MTRISLEVWGGCVHTAIFKVDNQQGPTVWHRPHRLQHARLPCSSPSLGACSNSCPLSWYAIQPSHSLLSAFFSCLQSFPASGSFPMSRPFESGSRSAGASTSASVLPMNIQAWFPVGSTVLISLLSKGLSRVFSSTTVWKINTSTK